MLYRLSSTVLLCWDRQLLLLLTLLIVVLTLVAQFPINYRIDVGKEDGVGSDLPLLRHVYTPEQSAGTSYRWTTGDTHIRLPGIGSRPLMLTVALGSANTEMATQGPQSFQVVLDDQPIGAMLRRQQGGRYMLLLPAHTPFEETQIAIQSATHIPVGDVRTLGINLDTIQIEVGWGAIPSARNIALWLVLVLWMWLLMRGLGFQPDQARIVLLAGIACIGLAALLDPPRLAFAAWPILMALGLAGCIAVLLDKVGRPLLANRGIMIADQSWRILCLLALFVFALRYAGKSYPDSMPGDIGFHVNRFADLLRGTLFILSKNRGVDFPYPPGFYLLLAPFTLVVDRRTLLQVAAAFLDALSPLLVYLIATQSRLIQNWRFAVVAAALYSLCGAGFMPTWWNFSTHIFTQFAHLLLVTCVVVAFSNGNNQATSSTLRRRSLAFTIILIVLQLLVYIGHFGFWVNTTILAMLALLGMLWKKRLRGFAVSPEHLAFLIAFVIAQILALLFFYTAYTGLILEQINQTATGGLSGLAGRGPVSSTILWAGLRDGLYQHIGLFPIPIAVCALFFQRGTAIVRLLLLGTFLIAALFALLPFLTGSTLSTRWLMFSIWAIAIGSAATLERLWHAGYTAKAMGWAIGIYVLWISASLWIGALAWRIRPVEPF